MDDGVEATDFAAHYRASTAESSRAIAVQSMEHPTALKNNDWDGNECKEFLLTMHHFPVEDCFLLVPNVLHSFVTGNAC